MENPVAEAVEKAGGVVKTARAMSVTHAAVRKWVDNKLPAERVLALSSISGVDPHLLRPDIYPVPMVTTGIGVGDSNGSVSRPAPG